MLCAAALTLSVGAACRTAAPPAPRSISAAGTNGFPTELLLRAAVRVADDEATLRLTVRLWSRERFELVASDLAGRTLWKVEADARSGRLEDRRRRSSCRFDPALPIELPGLRLPLEASALPDLLTGGRPAALEAAAPIAGDPLRRRDARGRIWQVDPDAGARPGWQLLDDAGEVQLVLRHEADLLRLASPPARIELRLRERARSALTTPAPPLAALDRLADCRALDVS